MKKITFIALLMAIIVTAMAQGPSKCAPGDSMAAECNGFGFQVDLNYNFIALKSTEMKNFHFAVMPGYHFCHYFFAGVGVGYANYNGFNYVPVFAHGTLNFSKGKVIPFIQGKVGLMLGKKSGTIDLNQINYQGEDAIPYYLSEVKGVFYIQPAIGIKFRLKDTQKLTFAVTLDGMMSKITPVTDPTNPLYVQNGTMGLKIGYEF